MLQDRLAQGLAMFGPAAAERAVLLINHLLTREPAASSRLLPHAGRRIEVRFEGAPAWWPALPPWQIDITPAGLLEWVDEAPGDAPALQATLQLAAPLQRAADLLTGDRSSIVLAGDAPLVADVQWLLEHLRWDVEDDLERWIGPVAAHGIARAGSRAAKGARDALRALGSLRGGPTRPTR